MTLEGGGWITNEVLKFKKVIEFESSRFSYIHLIIDGKELLMESLMEKEDSGHVLQQLPARFLLQPICTVELFTLLQSLAREKTQGTRKRKEVKTNMTRPL